MIAVLKGSRGSGVRFLRNVPQNVTVSVGQQAVLRCRVVNLGENTVSIQYNIRLLKRLTKRSASTEIRA